MHVEIEGRDRTVSFGCAAVDRILLAGLAAGHALPYECGTGTCGTCKAAVLAGDVDPGWPEAPGRAYLKEGADEVLMCQARPRGDCRLAVRARIGALAPEEPVPAAREGRIARIAPLTHNIVRLEIESAEPVSYDAGQFMLVGVEAVPGYRGWSMATWGGAPGTLVFTVKLMPGGLVSGWLAERDRAGTPVRLFGPLGRATFRPERDRANLLCVAGGSGLAPILAIVERARAAGHFAEHRADIFFGVRTAADLYAMETLTAAALAHPETVSLTAAFSERMPGAGELAGLKGLTFGEGLVHEVVGRAMAGRYDDVMGYLAGPPPMVEAMMRLLVMDAKLSPRRIRYDKFS